MHAYIRAHGESFTGKFYPYMKFLREGDPPSTISVWSASQQSQLQDSKLVARAASRVLEEEAMHRRICAKMVKFCTEKCAHLLDGLRSQLVDFTCSLYVWSWHVLQARAFGRRLPWSSLVPLADCLNHANLPVRYALDSIDYLGRGKVAGCNGGSAGSLDPGEYFKRERLGILSCTRRALNEGANLPR